MSKRHDKQRRRTRRSFESAEIIELHGSRFEKFEDERSPQAAPAPQPDPGRIPPTP